MSAQQFYGCHNRQPFRPSFPAQDGWYMDGHTRTPRMVPVRFVMSTDCNYTRTELGRADSRCEGCRWRVEP